MNVTDLFAKIEASGLAIKLLTEACHALKAQIEDMQFQMKRAREDCQKGKQSVPLVCRRVL